MRLMVGMSGLLYLTLLFWCTACWAHVKWFSEYTADTQPATLGALVTPVSLGLLALSLAGVFVARLTAARFALVRPVQLDEARLRRRHLWAAGVLKLGAIGAIALAWRTGIVFAPELKYESAVIPVLQVVALVGAAQRYGDRVLAASIFAMFLLGVVEFGIFHMLDYALFLGFGLFFALHDPADPVRRERAMTALYVGVGFSLCWAGLEKLVFPQWATEIVTEHPALTLGFPADFVVASAAFVEFTVGFLIATRTLPRLLAALLTALMAYTATLFGAIELVGHLAFHAALLCFILIGADARVPPAAGWRGSAWLGARHAGLYTVALGGLLIAYLMLAHDWH